MLHLWSRLRPHARPYLAPLILSGGLTLLLATFDLAAPWPLKIAVDHVIGRAPVGGPFAPLNRLSPLGLTAAAALMGLGLVAVAGGLRFLRAWLVGSATESLGADLRAAAFARLQRRSLRFHDRHQSGELVARLTTDISRIQDIVASTVQHVASDVLTLAGVFTVMVWLDVQLALAALDIVPGLVLLVFSTTPRIKTLQREARDRQAGLAAWAVERLRHIRAVRAFGREQEEDRTFRQAGQAVVTTSLQTLRVQALFSIAADLILAGGGALILFVGVQAVLAARMSIGELLVILTYLGSLYRPIRSLARLGSDLAKGAASWERLRELLEEEDDDVESPRVLAVGRSRSASPGPAPIEIDDVAFAYRPLVPVLRRISLGIEPGETLAIVGPSGAGKSTLLWLLLRFYDLRHRHGTGDPAGGSAPRLRTILPRRAGPARIRRRRSRTGHRRLVDESHARRRLGGIHPGHRHDVHRDPAARVLAAPLGRVSSATFTETRQGGEDGLEMTSLAPLRKPVTA